MGYDDSTREIMVVFQGSASIANWIASKHPPPACFIFLPSILTPSLLFFSFPLPPSLLDLNLFKLDYDYPGVNGARVHGGFYDCAQSLFNDAQAELRALFRDKPGYKLIVTGHSNLPISFFLSFENTLTFVLFVCLFVCLFWCVFLAGQGAAMAAMVGLMIRDTLGLEPEIQTFGEPRLGNQEYADYWKSRVNG